MNEDFFLRRKHVLYMPTGEYNVHDTMHGHLNFFGESGNTKKGHFYEIHKINCTLTESRNYRV